MLHKILTYEHFENLSAFRKYQGSLADTHRYIVRYVNSAMILAYFQISKMIVEAEQEGKYRDGYTRETILRLSVASNEEFGKGYSVSILEYIRCFYINYEMRISQSPIGKSQ